MTKTSDVELDHKDSQVHQLREAYMVKHQIEMAIRLNDHEAYILNDKAMMEAVRLATMLHQQLDKMQFLLQDEVEAENKNEADLADRQQAILQCTLSSVKYCELARAHRDTVRALYAKTVLQIEHNIQRDNRLRNGRLLLKLEAEDKARDKRSTAMKRGVKKKKK